ncbi:MAG: hypothetical protein ACPHSD_02655 [Candidatus Latescibacterota bacterium]
MSAEIDQYLARGYWIFRGIVPPTLLRDLRRQADVARALAHELNGPQTQRIQPLDQYGDDIDLQPFRDYVELSALRDAIEGLLGPGYTHAHLHIMGLLVEPAEHPWHCGWHRDGVVEVPPEARTPELAAEMNEFWHDLRVFNQVNCALYADSCTWFVPGSHLRSFDVSGEVQSAGVEAMQTPPAGLSDVEAERFYLQHCLDMPGAIPIHLNAGDFLLYRNLAWHTGLYLPYQPRATIHDIVSHPQGGDVTARWREAQKRARANWEATR